MNVSVLVATYGASEWADAGQAALESVAGAHEALALHLPDGTLAEVRNSLARVASGEWLCFLDADDRLGAGYLAAMNNALNVATDGAAHEEAPRLLLVPAVQHVAAGDCIGQPGIPNDGKWPDVNIAVIGTLVPRGLFLEVGGFHEWPIYEDWDLWLRCAAAGATLVRVPAAVYCATVRPRSRNRPSRRAAETYNAIRAANAGMFPDG